MKRIADLETCHATQTSHHGAKGEWVVYNEDRVEICRFPKDWDEKQVMFAIHFGRKFERIALNAGIEFQKSKNPKEIVDLQVIVGRQRIDIQTLKERNEMLAKELDNLTLKNTDNGNTRIN